MHDPAGVGADMINAKPRLKQPIEKDELSECARALIEEVGRRTVSIILGYTAEKKFCRCVIEWTQQIFSATADIADASETPITNRTSPLPLNTI